MNIIEDEILYSTIEQQIEKLKSQHLIINDIDSAKEQLQLFGYFNLIKGYRDPYIMTSNDTLIYRNGVTFEQIASLYLLDKNLRNSVMAAMLDLEEHVKAAAADVVSNSFGIHQNDYLQFRNYRDKKKRNSKFSLSEILKTMRNAMNSDKDPVLHYRLCHGIIPPWVLFKNIYFSTIVNFIDLFKPKLKSQMVKQLYDAKNLNYTDEQLRILMMDTLFLCLEYRNLAAHGGRTYNHVCNSKFLSLDFNFDEERKPQGFNRLLFLLYLIDYKKPFILLNDTLTEEVNRHCNMFPEDITYIGQILHIDFVRQQIAWISDGSNKYHHNPFCSGMTNSYKKPLEEILKAGYQPCKRCVKQD